MSTRNYGLDSLKFICACLIVFIHVNYPYRSNVLPITRCAVPIFFMISGYFLFTENCAIYKERVVKQIKKIAHILLWSSLIYLLYVEVISYVKTGYLQSFTIQDVVNLIVFNVHPFANHLWYLIAYFYVLLITSICFNKRMFNGRKCFVVAGILLIVNLCLGSYSDVLFNVYIPSIIVRNAYVFGMPCFLIGGGIKLIENQLDKYTTRKCILAVLTLFFIVLSVAEAKTINYFVGEYREYDFFVSTIFLSVMLFVLFLRSDIKNNWASRLGVSHSLYIYILHPILITVLSGISSKININDNYVYKLILPLLVIISSIVVISLFLTIRDNLKHTKTMV